MNHIKYRACKNNLLQDYCISQLFAAIVLFNEQLPKSQLTYNNKHWFLAQRSVDWLMTQLDLVGVGLAGLGTRMWIRFRSVPYVSLFWDSE